VAIELVHHPRITVFQPFRIATLVRGLALVLIAGRLVELWERGGRFARVRSVLIAVALTGDWMLVVVTLAEVGTALAETVGKSSRGPRLVFAGLLAYGLYFLSRHDTESGHWPIMLVLVGGLAAPVCRRISGPRFRDPSILRWATALSWVVPALALCAGLIPPDDPVARGALVRGLVARCRFTAVPIDDIERLGAWCREHTPPAARFIGPPASRLPARRSMVGRESRRAIRSATLILPAKRLEQGTGTRRDIGMLCGRRLKGKGPAVVSVAERGWCVPG
jgi:hypothetical protein